ncbi:MAG: alpha/beta hydrolase [Candidatus Omnitrophota bacterium]|nr:alpha/beta hydrolase [Candidatus Omnitrophota bacterium]
MKTAYSKTFLWCSLLAVSVLCSGCAGTSRLVDLSPERKGFVKELIQTDTFNITVFSRITGPGMPITVYIEGDGRAWIKKRRLSGDPTPRNTLVFDLAAMDPAKNVVYMARPCQYTPREEEPLYDPVYWSSERFSEPVIVSADQVIDRLKKRTGAENIDLIGYSGGGAVAVLVAARRNDISSIRTIAGNLDHEEVNRYHKASRLNGSLNPIDLSEKVAGIPQNHFTGDKDKTVPPSIAERFIDSMPRDNRAQEISVKGCTHHKGWRENWPGLLKTPFK